MLGSFGFGELGLLVGVLLAASSLIGLRSRSSYSVLVLQKFYVERTDPDGIWVHIAGRSSGLLSWMLTILGLDDQTILRVTKEGLSLTRSSLRGEHHDVVLLEQISSTHCGYRKPVILLLLGIGLLGVALIRVVFFSQYVDLFGLVEYPGGAIEGVLGIGCLAAYALLKTLDMTFVTTGGTTLGVAFKRSVIENITIDLPEALEVIELVNHKIREAATPLPPIASQTPR